MQLRPLLLAFLLACPWPALGQTASLVADRISIEADERLIAEGAVEVFHEGTRVTASRVIYDRADETLTIEGPITLSEGADTVILASSAELDAQLERGILRSARLVLDRQLQLAAAELTRVSGRYTRLSRAVASSCQICERGEAPLWEIRARRVLRDETERQLYFDSAQLRVAGLPVFYIPRLRLPDPTLRRATGFLVPRIRSRSQLSTGIVAPYFIKLGDHADLTLAPYLSPRTTTLEFAYRQLYRRGDLSFEGAISDDDIRPGETRGYLFAEGSYRLPRDYTLRFDLELVSDRSYLFDYGYSEKDRLDSSVGIFRVRDDQTFAASLTSYETLRASELPIEQELPSEILAFDLRQRLYEDPAWGSFWAEVDAAALARPSQDPGVGRDVARLGFGLDWQASRVLPFGLVAEAEADLGYDVYRVAEDPAFPETLSRSRAGAAITLRWPLERAGRGGVRHLLEPVAQIGWADVSGDAAPNEDSTVVEFDEGNLLALSRFPGRDRYETGARLNLGVGWSRRDPAGWSVGATVGRILRLEDNSQFGSETGISGTSSDWLLALHYRLGERVSVTSRSLLGDDLDIARSETRFGWANQRASVTGTHLWRSADVTENTTEDLSELSLDGTLRLNDWWTASTEWRFDAADSETTRAGLGLTFQNECLEVGLSLSRRFTSSTNVEPATEFDLRVALTGLGTGGEARAARRKCRG